ncbi:hypothetical protein LCGC14_2041060, partial [marine sediment metagenome]
KNKSLIIEIAALIVLIIIMVGLPGFVFMNAPWNSEYRDYRVINLTAVAKDGVWTEEKVTNLNYWNRKFKPAGLELNRGEKVLFRLTSMDVTHTFYVPDLNIGPVEVKGGTVYEVPFIADTIGSFRYYCTTICGDCHYYMQGEILVSENNETPFQTSTVKITAEPLQSCDHEHQPELSGSFVETGYNLYTSLGCITCHGESGQGGIYNPNYVNSSVPSLNDLAEKMRLFWQEDAEIVIDLLEKSADLNMYLEDPPFRQYNRFLAQFESYATKIHDGAHVLQKADTAGPQPPLYMPAWKHQLTDQEINAILAYLIEQFDWED